MHLLDDELKRRLLLVLHRGWVEARLLAKAGRNEQLHDLADALEILPGCVDQPDSARLDLALGCLSDYQEKYRGCCFDYLAQVQSDPVPTHF